MTVLVLITLCFCVSHGYYVATDPDSQPVLRLWNSEVVDWNRGQVGVLLDTSRAVRINARGIHFYDVEVESLQDASCVRCVRTRDSLCRMDNGSLVLPFTQRPRVSSNGLCLHSVGRLLQPGFYDISACDVANGMDILWSNNVLFVDWHLALPTYLYALVALLVLSLVVSLGQNMAQLLGDDHAKTYPVSTECLCVVLVSVLILSHDPWRVWVANHDRFMFTITVAYILFYVIRHAFELFYQHVYTFNVIVACLILTTARLYGTFETPYSAIFLMLLLSRLFHKLRYRRFVFLTGCDIVYVAYFYYWCFRPSFYDVNQAPVYLVGMLFVALRVGEFTSHQEALKSPPECNLVDRVIAEHRGSLTTRAHGHYTGDDPRLLQFFDLSLR